MKMQITHLTFQIMEYREGSVLEVQIGESSEYLAHKSINQLKSFMGNVFTENDGHAGLDPGPGAPSI